MERDGDGAILLTPVKWQGYEIHLKVFNLRDGDYYATVYDRKGKEVKNIPMQYSGGRGKKNAIELIKRQLTQAR